MSVAQQKPAYFLVFLIICSLGAIATLFPHKCSPEVRSTQELHPSRFTEGLGIRVVHGHHSDCVGFMNHEIQFRKKSLCAGCLGLLAGSLIAIILTVIFFTERLSMPPQTGYLGLIFITAGLVYNLVIPESPPILRIILNAFLVIGFALVHLILTNIYDLGLMSISLSIFWMFSRMRLSRWSHNKICSNCDMPCT